MLYAHSKIARVRVLSWPLPLLTIVCIFACHGGSVTEVVSKKRKEISLYANASEAEIFTLVRRGYLTSFAGLHFEN